MSLSNKCCFEEDGKEEIIVLTSFRSDFTYPYSYGHGYFHKMRTTIRHHVLLTKRHEYNDFLSFCNSLKVSKRQSALILAILQLGENEMRGAPFLYFLKIKSIFDVMVM